jgi:hypothetical protein
MRKRFADLQLSDFDAIPVWRSADGDGVEPCEETDCVEDGAAVWVRFHGKLSDATPVEGIAFAQSPPPSLMPRLMVIDGKRYDVDFSALDEAQSANFAESLNRAITHVFPIYIRAELIAASTGDTLSQELDVTGPPA